jgi:hypothetical protein
MNFLACDGIWSVTASGINCTGELLSLSSERLASEITASSDITPEESTALYDGAMSLFISVFVFLCLKRVMR